MPLKQAPGILSENSPGIKDLALAAFDAMEAAVFVTDATGTIGWVNRAFTRLTGWPADEAIGRNPRILQSGIQDKQYYEDFWSTISAGKPIRTHVINRKRSGEFYAAVQRVTPLCSDDGRPHHFVAIQEPLAGDEVPVFDELPVAVITTDRMGRVRVWNRAAEELLGWRSAGQRGKSLADCVLREEAWPDAMAAMRLACAGGRWERELPVRGQDGRLFTGRVQVAPQMNSSGHVTGLIAAIVDVSEEARLRSALAHSERIEATGQLAASLAHDVNNNLTAIALYAKVAASALDDGHPVNDDLKQIERASERTAALTRQLLVFSRKQILHPAAVNLNEVVSNLKGLLRHVAREDIELTFDEDAHIEPVWVDASQVEQVLVNLVVNARDAMTSGGTIRIATSMETCPAGQRFGVIEVADTGAGMSAEVREHIFEPFFTTKGERGTGLGLATVHGVVTQSNGHISVKSAPGRGATFRVAFPAALSRFASATPSEPDATAAPAITNLTVLVVDDDANVREVVRRVLQAHGYAAIAAGTPAEAVKIARDRRGAIDLVISDVVMPRANGPEMMELLMRAGVRAPAIFMSGYVEEPERLASQIPASHFLTKPFAAAELIAMADRVMAEPTPDIPQVGVPQPLTVSNRARARRGSQSVA